MAKFDQHLFISYAHLDNQPLTKGEEGWVTRFHETLEALLSMHLGSRARVWRDQKLQGNDDFDSEIVDQFGHTAGLIAVLTPRYLKSEWCTREIREFCEAAEQSGGALVDNKSRVFKVIKTPVGSQDSLPEPVKKVLGYDFFVLQDDDTPLELDPTYGDEFAHGFAQKVARLSWQISQLVNDLEAATDGHDDDAAAASSPRSTVYVAECSSDMRDARELLIAELQRLGYSVLPDQRLPADEADYLQAVDDLLQRSALSIHLVGAQYGLVPDGPTLKSAPMLQNELAAGRSSSADLRRVIWLPAGTKSDHEVQQDFIDSLHQDEAMQVGADLITGDLEALRAAVHATLEAIESERAQPDVADDTADDVAKRVYLLCDKEDRKATVPIRKFLGRVGLEVDLPAFEGDAAEVRRANQTLLAGCDVVLVFYGAGDEAWKRTIDSELRKLPGYLAGKPLPVVHTYLAEPRTEDKEDLVDMEEPNLIAGFDGFTEPSMSGLLGAIGASADTS